MATDISPGMLETLSESAERLGLDVRAIRCEADRLPFPDESFDLVFGHAVLHHLPDLDAAFAEFRRVLRPGGTLAFCGEPSRYGDLISQVPKRAAVALAPAWRRLMRATKRDYFAEPDGREEAEARVARGRPRVHAAETSSRSPATAGFEDVRVTRRGADRDLVRLDEPHARGDRRARGRAVALAPVRVPRLPDAPGARPHRARGPAAARRSSTTCSSRRGSPYPSHEGQAPGEPVPLRPTAYIAFSQLGVTLQALVAPKSFYDDFPLGRGWVEAYPAYNEHLIYDYGAYTLGALVALVLAGIWLDRRVVQLAIISWLVGRQRSISSITWSPSTGSGRETRSPTSPGSSLYIVLPGWLLVRSSV